MHPAQIGNAIPAPLDDDDGDVAFALASAQARWDHGARSAAIAFVHEAVDAATHAGQAERAAELRQIADHLTAISTTKQAGVIDELEESRQPVAPSHLMNLIENALSERSADAHLDSNADVQLEGIALDHIRGLERMTPTALQQLKDRARLETLDNEDEIGRFAFALVVEGSARVTPEIADGTVAVLAAGDAVFAAGTLPRGMSLRLVAQESQTRVALWTDEAFTSVLTECPSAVAEIRARADRFQAVAGMAMGPLGQRLGDTQLDVVIAHMDVRAYSPGDVVLERGSALSGMYVVGAGRLELAQTPAHESQAKQLVPGDVLFPVQTLAQGTVPMTVRAGLVGALVLSCNETTAQNLLGGVPGLVETLEALIGT